MTAAAPLQPAAPHRGIKALLIRHPLVFYFLIAYAGSWLAWMPIVLSDDGLGLLPYKVSPLLAIPALGVGTFTGPFLSAFIMTGMTEGRAGIGRLVRRYVLWRVGFRWYLFVLVGIPAILVVGTVVLPGTLASFQGPTPRLLLIYPLVFAYTVFLGGPLGEETGWRGFALPRLQRLHGPLVGSLILGPLWAFWHFPLFFSGHWTPPTITNIVEFVFSTTALAIVFTWVFNNTMGSLLIAILMHASLDTFANWMDPLFPKPDYGELPVLIGFVAVALVVVAFTRGRLSYEHYRQEASDTN